MKRILIIAIFIALIFLPVKILFAYGGKVHSKINEESANFSQLDSMLKNHLNFSSGIEAPLIKNKKTKKIWEWIAYGGEAEDLGWCGS